MFLLLCKYVSYYHIGKNYVDEREQVHQVLTEPETQEADGQTKAQGEIRAQQCTYSISAVKVTLTQLRSGNVLR